MIQYIEIINDLRKYFFKDKQTVITQQEDRYKITTEGSD